MQTEQYDQHSLNKQLEADARLARFIQILMQINEREQIVEYEEPDKRNTSNTSQSK